MEPATACMDGPTLPATRAPASTVATMEHALLESANAMLGGRVLLVQISIVRLPTACVVQETENVQRKVFASATQAGQVRIVLNQL